MPEVFLMETLPLLYQSLQRPQGSLPGMQHVDLLPVAPKRGGSLLDGRGFATEEGSGYEPKVFIADALRAEFLCDFSGGAEVEFSLGHCGSDVLLRMRLFPKIVEEG